MKVIDCEHHYYHPELIGYLSSRDTPPMYRDNILTYHQGAFIPIGISRPYRSDVTLLEQITDLGEMRLESLDDAGITTAVLSSAPGIESLPGEAGIEFARKTNDAVAAASKQYPDRFLGTICLPATHVEASLIELERAVKVLGLKVWHTHSNYGNETLADDKYIPLLAKCEELGVPIYLHPHNPYSEYMLDSGMLFAAAGFGFCVDTMKTSLNLILKGRLDRFPKLKLILGHMGEVYPYLMERLNNRFFCAPDPTVRCAHNFSYYFQNKNIFMTTSGIEDPYVVLFAIKKVGIDSILFATDFPFENIKASVDFIKNLPLSEEDKAKIFYKNAETYIL